MREKPVMQLGANVREHRDRLGLTQVRLARRANVDVSIVGRLERGVGNPNLRIIFAIAEALDVPVSSLLIGVGLPVSNRRS